MPAKVVPPRMLIVHWIYCFSDVRSGDVIGYKHVIVVHGASVTDSEGAIYDGVVIRKPEAEDASDRVLTALKWVFLLDDPDSSP